MGKSSSVRTIAPRRARWILFCALTLGTAAGRVHAIDDVPEGVLRWIQGYDGNPPTPGFRVDGRLRIEAPDEPQPVGVQLESGRIEVGSSGEILVQYGPGGSRFIQGDLVNEGLVSLKSVLLCNQDCAEWVNRGIIEASTYMGLGVTGKGARFRQVSGEVRVADPSSRFEFYNQSQFIYEGGKVSARPLLVASSARVDAPATQDLTLRFLGQDCRFEGCFPPDLSVTVASDATYGSASLGLTNITAIEGTIELAAADGSPGAMLRFPESGAILKPQAVLRVKPGGGISELQGALSVEGLLSVDGSARWTGAGRSVTNRGRIVLPAGGRLATAAPLVQAAGTLEVDGGELALSAGLSVEGGALMAAGVISGNVTNAALSVVDQEEPARLRGDWTQTALGTLQVRVRPVAVSAGTALQVMGTLNLKGSLEVVLAEGVKLADGAELRLIQADRMEGWFDRLILPSLENGLQWRVLPSDEEVRLGVRTSPSPLVIEWLQRDAGDRLRVSGPWSTGLKAVIRVSSDLKHWTTYQGLGPFAGLASFPVPLGAQPGPEGMTVYQAILVPVGSPD